MCTPGPARAGVGVNTTWPAPIRTAAVKARVVTGFMFASLRIPEPEPITTISDLYVFRTVAVRLRSSAAALWVNAAHSLQRVQPRRRNGTRANDPAQCHHRRLVRGKARRLWRRDRALPPSPGRDRPVHRRGPGLVVRLVFGGAPRHLHHDAQSAAG